MANAANGEPLGLRNAVVLYSAQTVQGTPVTPATDCGLARVGLTKKSNNAHYWAAGSPDFVAAKGGMTECDWTMRMEAVLTGAKTLLQQAVRTAGVLPYITLGFGYKDDVPVTPNKDADEIQDACVNTLELAFDTSNGHGPLSANLFGYGGLVTDLTTLSPVLPTTTPWWSYEAVVTKATSAYPVRSFRMSVNHNVTRDCVAPGAAPSTFKRGWTYATPHREMISGSISRYAKSGVSVQADSIAQFAMQVLFTSLVDSTTLTLALTSVDFGEEQVAIDDGGIFYTTPFTAKSWNLT